ncbi:hypothetical protein K1719_045891 [Acacia pycnantha]|nr:hypothetical protein K1719_045891 [Acacia pycnantha]
MLDLLYTGILFANLSTLAWIQKILKASSLKHRVQKLKGELAMATTACFIIVSRNDIPIYESEVGTATKDLAWTTSLIFSLTYHTYPLYVAS